MGVVEILVLIGVIIGAAGGGLLFQRAYGRCKSKKNEHISNKEVEMTSELHTVTKEADGREVVVIERKSWRGHHEEVTKAFKISGCLEVEDDDSLASKAKSLASGALQKLKGDKNKEGEEGSKAEGGESIESKPKMYIVDFHTGELVAIDETTRADELVDIGPSHRFSFGLRPRYSKDTPIESIIEMGEPKEEGMGIEDKPAKPPSKLKKFFTEMKNIINPSGAKKEDRNDGVIEPTRVDEPTEAEVKDIGLGGGDSWDYHPTGSGRGGMLLDPYASTTTNPIYGQPRPSDASSITIEMAGAGVGAIAPTSSLTPPPFDV